MTAFAIAGGGPIAPDSPIPFTPSWFTGEGVMVWPVSKSGM